MELAENFFSRKSVIARGRSVTPFFWAKGPLSPPPKKTASAAKPILACFYKTLTMGARRSCGQLTSQKSLKKQTVLSFFGIIKDGEAHSDAGCLSNTPSWHSLSTSFLMVSFWTFGTGKAWPW